MNKIKAPAGAGALFKLALAGGAFWFTASKALYNVEGGHRAIVFNRIEGIKDKVARKPAACCDSCGNRLPSKISKKKKQDAESKKGSSIRCSRSQMAEYLTRSPLSTKRKPLLLSR